jgi:DNA adenine methylase
MSLVARTGGKKLLKKQIVDNFPENYESLTYVELFIGGGSIYFYKEPSKKEIINDIDPKLILVYKGIKKFNADDINESINGTYSKTLFNKIYKLEPTNEYDKFIKQLLLYRLSFMGRGKYYGVHPTISSDYNKHKERLKKTLILNKNYKDVIEKYDSPTTFFYLDPPYEGSNKTHYDFPEFDFLELFEILKNIKGYFLLSYNYSIDVIKLFKDFNIQIIKTRYGSGTKGGQDKIKKELLISNY